jgi:hypothetical protein
MRVHSDVIPATELMLPRLKGAKEAVSFNRFYGWRGAPRLPGAVAIRVKSHPYRDDPTEDILRDGSDVAIEMRGGLIVNERGTVVTFRQRCEECSYVFEWNKTTIVPAFSSRKVRPFTCPSVR